LNKDMVVSCHCLQARRIEEERRAAEEAELARIEEEERKKAEDKERKKAAAKAKKEELKRQGKLLTGVLHSVLFVERHLFRYDESNLCNAGSGAFC
jgi:hypothetical protein